MNMRNVNWKKLIFILLVILMVGGSSYYSYKTASSPKLHDYIGDEVWYVPASRNILHRLGIAVHYINRTSGAEGVNVIFSSDQDKNENQLAVLQIAAAYNYTVYSDYTNFPAVYFEIPEKNLRPFMEALRSKYPEIDIVTGFRYPDKDNIQNYLNTEHPFLGKDFIMLGMRIRDDPFYWRLPGVIALAIINILVVLTAYRITKSYLASLIALLFSAVDPTLMATSVAAMLDIYVALFVALFVYLLVSGKDISSGFAVGLGAAAKLNGGFGYPVLFIKLLKERKGFKHFLLSGFIFPGLGFLIPEFPAIKALGFRLWLRYFLGSFRWHLSYKGPNPNTSPFWQWFVDLRPFPFHFNPNVFAETDPFLLSAMIVFIFAIPYIAMKRKNAWLPLAVFWSTIGMFALQYALGGTTQFSFYATALVPEAAVVMGVVLYDIIKWDYFRDSIKIYWSFITGGWRWLKRKASSLRSRR
ncbi:dolichyl-phosphate-mannose--protein mannosyltransferase [Thermococcus sp.]